MDLEQIEKLVGLVAKANITEVTLRSDNKRITVRKPVVPASKRVNKAKGAASATNGHASTSASSSGALVPLDMGGQTASSANVTITAPMVGIFHHAEPPVAVGTRVQPNRVVGIIESMKLMNDVRTETGGIVQELLIEAGMAVEFGQPLLTLSPDTPEAASEDNDE